MSSQDFCKKFTNSVVDDFKISIVTGYAGHLASELLYSAKNYIPAINETVALDFAHVHSYLGSRSLIVMKNAGLNESFLPLINSTLLGTNAGMVLWVVDDLFAEGSEIAQDSRRFVNDLGIKPIKPKDWNELYTATRNAYVVSEKRNIPQVIILGNELFSSKTDFARQELESSTKPSFERLVLHPTTARDFAEKYNERKQTWKSSFPIARKLFAKNEKLESSKYISLFSTIPKNMFDIVIGDFGTYTLADGSPIQYGLHYGSAIASGVGAWLAGARPLVFVGEGGFTSGFESVLELARKQPDMKIILIENGGISGEEEIGLDILQKIADIGITTERMSAEKIEDLPEILRRQGLLVVAVNYE